MSLGRGGKGHTATTGLGDSLVTAWGFMGRGEEGVRPQTAHATTTTPPPTHARTRTHAHIHTRHKPHYRHKHTPQIRGASHEAGGGHDGSTTPSQSKGRGRGTVRGTNVGGGGGRGGCWHRGRPETQGLHQGGSTRVAAGVCVQMMECGQAGEQGCREMLCRDTKTPCRGAPFLARETRGTLPQARAHKRGVCKRELHWDSHAKAHTHTKSVTVPVA